MGKWQWLSMLGNGLGLWEDPEQRGQEGRGSSEYGWDASLALSLRMSCKKSFWAALEEESSGKGWMTQQAPRGSFSRVTCGLEETASQQGTGFFLEVREFVPCSWTLDPLSPYVTIRN